MSLCRTAGSVGHSIDDGGSRRSVWVFQRSERQATEDGRIMLSACHPRLGEVLVVVGNSQGVGTPTGSVQFILFF